MSPLIFLSILSISCWLNLSHGMIDDALYSSTEHSQIYNLDYAKDQEAFLGEFVPIGEKYPTIFKNLSGRLTMKKTLGGIVYSPQFTKNQKSHEYFRKVKNEINKLLSQSESMTSKPLSVDEKDKVTFRALKLIIDIYLNPINGIFKAAQTHKILEVSGYHLTYKIHDGKPDQNDNVIKLYKTVEFRKNEQVIDALSVEALRFSSKTPLYIEQIFNKEKKVNEAELIKYYEELDEESNDTTIATRSIIYYALVHLCGYKKVINFARRNIRNAIKDKQAVKNPSIERTTVRFNPTPCSSLSKTKEPSESLLEKTECSGSLPETTESSSPSTEESHTEYDEMQPHKVTIHTTKNTENQSQIGLSLGCSIL